MRREPSQARAHSSVDAIVEATAQILEREEDASTNRIAASAGVSIGTLYQYFPNREAILHFLANREQARIVERIEATLGTADPAQPETALRAALRVFLHAFDNRHRLRRHLILTLLPRAPQMLVGRGLDESLARILGDLAKRHPDRFRSLSETALFVLTRAVMGVVRAAIVERRSLHDPVLEDEITRLMMTYLDPGEKLRDHSN